MTLRGQHLSADDRVADLLSHPALSRFARLVMPWGDRAVDGALPLRRIGSLMPYHSHVEPEVIVASINRIVDAVDAGETVFYDFYSEAEQRTDPTKRATGLFFFRGVPGAPFALIAPGGGFEYVATLHEGFPYAAQIVERGYNAFVLKYRVEGGRARATEDMAVALSFLVRHAGALRIDPRHYSLWGSSAGARMAALIGSHGAARFGGDSLPKPAAVVMAYTGHADYAADEPPTFVAVGAEDPLAPPSTTKRRANALREGGTQVELHVFQGLGHGFGTGASTAAAGWIASAIRFWHGAIATHEAPR